MNVRLVLLIATVFAWSGNSIVYSQGGWGDHRDQPISEAEWNPSTSCDQVVPGNLYAGYSFMFTKLHYKESFEGMISDLNTGTQTLVPFEHNYELTPRVWLGLRTGEGLGARASYWNYNHTSDGLELTSDGQRIPSAIATSVIFPASVVAAFPGDQLSITSSLKATLVDLEGTYDARIDRLEMTMGGGIRYAHTDQRSDALVTPGPVPGAAAAALNWMREFEGFGPLISANGRMPFSCRGLYATGGVNVSFLFGEKTLRRSVLNDATPPPNQGLPFLAFDNADEITGVYGSRLGLGWQRNTQMGNLSIEGAYEGQLWTEGGSPTITFAGFNSLSLSVGLAY